MNTGNQHKVIVLAFTVTVILAVFSGCVNDQDEANEVTLVSATVENISPEETSTLDLTDMKADQVWEYEVRDLETNCRYPVCDFELVQGETIITIVSCKWDVGSNLRIGIQGENGVEKSLDASKGALSRVSPDFSTMPSGEYTLYIENMSEDKISSVNLTSTID